MSPADNTPNFDSMSPEEIMKWMESLAKRQGADQGFTTAADMEIPDIDPDSVVIDEPGYVPSEGKDRGKKIETIIPPRQPKPAVTTPPPAQAEPVPQRPAATVPVEPPAPAVQKPAASLPATPAPAQEEPASALSWLESLAADQGGDFPSLDLSSIAADLNPVSEAPAAAANPIDWLENLALEQGVAPAEEPETEAIPAAEFEDPNSWLGSLAQAQGVQIEDEPLAPAEGLDDPNSWLGSLAAGLGADIPDAKPASAVPAEDDSMVWMESLAKRQGAKGEELVTSADLDMPAPASATADGPGYIDYTFETPSTPVTPQPEFSLPVEEAVPIAPDADDISNLQDPAAWLDALASAQGFEGKAKEAKAAAPKPAEPKMADDEIQRALAKGEYVPHDQMEAWMNRQLEIGAQRSEPEELSAYDPDAPAVKAEIPDWLLEQVGSMPPEEEEPAAIAPPQPLPPSGPALIDTIVEPPPVENIPDWLKEDSSAESDLEDIFAPTESAAPPVAAVASTSGIQIDPTDPWVEALEMEYAQNKGQPVPAMQPPAAPAVPATPPPSAPAVAAALKEAALQPEAELPRGEPEPIPAWLQGVVDAPEAQAIVSDIPDWLASEMPVEAAAPIADAAISEIPDWLKSIDVEAAEVPGWLTETLGTDTSEEYATAVTVSPPTPVVTAPPPAPVQQPVAPAAAIVPSRPSYAPVPVQVTNIDVPATLNNARSLATSNDVDGSLQHYELLIRANAELDAVVNDLTKLTEKVKTKSAVFRVLGDGLMRKGQLQAALDIYRKALNQL